LQPAYTSVELAVVCPGVAPTIVFDHGDESSAAMEDLILTAQISDNDPGTDYSADTAQISDNDPGTDYSADTAQISDNDPGTDYSAVRELVDIRICSEYGLI